MKENAETDLPREKEIWETPQVLELDVRSTETNAGAGADGGAFGNTAS